ncbi:MarR family winged helix-turn-helix transcriptional regulator [Pedobacter sp. Leaf170]|uniref:MarR family winged helix-turn-helix transcriptional regulator n=1 Tax=Pedobacter sp. Leaf170 TaxID=2876558 RepID=UPI001E597B56|nr:MarR family winged helix-turn-helix transcriptional regulator [Pedobacter sp. Leaf170]
MMYNLLDNLISLVKTYEQHNAGAKDDLNSFLNWMNAQALKPEEISAKEPDWPGKIKGRSADSVINTSLVHLYRYAKIQAKAAISESVFSTPDDFIYLINLNTGGNMTKSALIKENIHDKPAGTLIIQRLLDKGLISQQPSAVDKRNMILNITKKGIEELNKYMDKIRAASANVTGALTADEKTQLITLLQKLEDFHYVQNFEKN